MKQLSSAMLNKLAAKIAYKSRPHIVSVNYSINSEYKMSWFVSVWERDSSLTTMINDFDVDAVKKLKIAAAKGIIPGQEVLLPESEKSK